MCSPCWCLWSAESSAPVAVGTACAADNSCTQPAGSQSVMAAFVQGGIMFRTNSGCCQTCTRVAARVGLTERSILPSEYVTNAAAMIPARVEQGSACQARASVCVTTAQHTECTLLAEQHADPNLRVSQSLTAEGTSQTTPRKIGCLEGTCPSPVPTCSHFTLTTLSCYICTSMQPGAQEDVTGNRGQGLHVLPLLAVSHCCLCNRLMHSTSITVVRLKDAAPGAADWAHQSAPRLQPPPLPLLLHLLGGPP